MKTTLLILMALVMVGCMSSGSTYPTDAEEEMLYGEFIQPTIKSGKGYEFFKVKVAEDSFRGVRTEFLASPKMRYEDVWDNETDLPTGKPGKLDFVAGVAKPKDAEKVGKKGGWSFLADSLLLGKKYGWGYSSWSSSDINSPFGWRDRVLLTTTKSNASSETRLYAGPPFSRAWITDFKEARAPDTTKYPVTNVKKDTEFYGAAEVKIPTKDIIKLAESGADLRIRVYGNMRNGDLTAYVPTLPNWYLKAYVFSLLKNNWLDQESVGQALYKEFKEKVQD